MVVEGIQQHWSSVSFWVCLQAFSSVSPQPISPAPIESHRPHWFTWLLRLFFPFKAMFILLGKFFFCYFNWIIAVWLWNSPFIDAIIKFFFWVFSFSFFVAFLCAVRGSTDYGPTISCLTALLSSLLWCKAFQFSLCSWVCFFNFIQIFYSLGVLGLLSTSIFLFIWH